MLSLVYGAPYSSLKANFWQNLENSINSFAGAWIGIGDFNCITSQAKKFGGRPFTFSSDGGFYGFINNNGLIDLGFQGNKFTWSNKWPVWTIKQRLDRAITNDQWRLLFPRANLFHHPITASNHAPILLSTTGESRSYPKPFRFEAMWTRDPSSHDVIKTVWSKLFHGSVAFCLTKKKKKKKS